MSHVIGRITDVNTSAIPSLLAEFSAKLTSNFALAPANPAQPEDQLKAPTVELIKGVGSLFGASVDARTEALADGIRPDIGVTVESLLTGHVELKAPGKGVRPQGFSDKHDREQFKRLSSHPNLLYTDGNEWALYRHGERIGPIAKAAGDVRIDGETAFDERGAQAFELLIRDFLGWQPLVPSNPRALAEMLAPITRLLRDTVELTLADPVSALSHLATDWRDFFFPDADDAQFADAYAQTLTYALLLARVEGETDLHSHAPERLDRRHSLLAGGSLRIPDSRSPVHPR
jgi:hypothetical protein